MEIKVELSKRVFWRFGVFDTWIRRRQWRSPALFACILCLCGAICFTRRQVSGAGFLGTVLITVGLGIPAVYVLSFFLSLRLQMAIQKLDRPQYAYTVKLLEGPEGITVENGREKASYRWDQVHHAYRGALAVYIYITPQRAFLLPYACLAEGPEVLWGLLERQLSATGRWSPGY